VRALYKLLYPPHHQRRSYLIQAQPSHSNDDFLEPATTNFHDAFTAKHNADGHGKVGTARTAVEPQACDVKHRDGIASKARQRQNKVGFGSLHKPG
jgi:hypothetical protein